MRTGVHPPLIQAIQDAMHETAIAFFTHDLGLRDGPALTLGESQAHLRHRADVTAIVAFRGIMAGGVHLSAPMHAALGLASAFWGEPLESFNDTARDALGELTNILAGSLKSRIDDGIDLSPPLIIAGPESPADQQADQLESARCYFMTTHGPLFIEVFHDSRES